MKQIIVHVGGLTVEEKQRVNEALAKIANVSKIKNATTGMVWFYAPSGYDLQVSWNGIHTRESPTHTPQQVLEMAGMAEQGHVHAESMALYADYAKSYAEPWKLWQIKGDDGVWWDCNTHPRWMSALEYRRKPKTHIVHGVEVPDLRIDHKHGQWYWYPDASIECLVRRTIHDNESSWDIIHRYTNNLCYEDSEDGKQAAILHAKAWLGIA